MSSARFALMVLGGSLAGVMFGAAQVHGACPVSRICCNCYWVEPCGGCHESSTAELEATCPSWSGQGSGGHGRFDLVAGHLTAAFNGWFDGDNTGRVVAVDEFTLVGAAESGTHSLTVVLKVSGYIMPIAPVQASLTTLGTRVEYLNDSYSYPEDEWTPFADSLEIVIEIPVGQPFTVEYAVGGQGILRAWNTIEGQLAFKNLPPGGVVQSCQGFGSAPVPTHPQTWGSLKSRYR